jgi:hypothetical protein
MISSEILIVGLVALIVDPYGICWGGEKEKAEKLTDTTFIIFFENF